MMKQKKTAQKEKKPLGKAPSEQWKKLYELMERKLQQIK
jgi:hypothetical protein